MINARSYTSAAVLNNKIYISGGWNGTNDLTQTERYDPVRDVWESLTPMENER